MKKHAKKKVAKKILRKKTIDPKTKVKALFTAFAPPERSAKKEILFSAKVIEKKVLTSAITQQMMNSVPTAVVVLNKFRQIVFANKTFLSIVGAKKPAEVLGKRPGEAVGCAHSKDNEAGCGTTEFCTMCGAVNAILLSQRGDNVYRECRITQFGGGALDLAVSAAPLKVGGEAYTIFAAIDISHEKRRKLLERTFFHDILNTSSVLYSYAEAFRDRDPRILETAGEKIYSATNRLIDEIQAQRQLLAAENEELTTVAKSFSVRALLKEIADSFSSHPVAYGKKIEMDNNAENFTAVADATQLGRVITNMLKNALEASEQGHSVSCSCRINGDNFEISVHNETFMPHDVQLQIFQRSFSTKGSGRGIGTYSMKLLSEKYLGGHVSFTTDKIEGTTFTATYPLKPTSKTK